MRAVIAPNPGGPEALEIADLAIPDPGPSDVVIAVTAAGVNRADTLQRMGFYPPPPGASDVLGLECSGRIQAVGSDVTEFSEGDEVCALLSGGGYAEYVAVPAGQVAPVPSGLDLVSAGGLMETACTVWSNVVMVAGLEAGQTFLVHGGSSGIGTMAIQVAKALGARVVTTVGSADKAAAVTELGADVVINYRDDDFADVMKDRELEADVILDIMGAKYLPPNVDVLGTDGHLVVIGMQGGVKGELNLSTLLSKRASVTATSLRARPKEGKAAVVAATREGLFPMVTRGTVRLVIDSTFALDDVRAAHEHLESSAHIGKILLEV